MGHRQSKATTADVLDRVQVIYLELSPENLAADGERSGIDVKRRRRALERELQACFRWLGRSVTEDEAFARARGAAPTDQLYRAAPSGPRGRP